MDISQQSWLENAQEKILTNKEDFAKRSLPDGAIQANSHLTGELMPWRFHLLEVFSQSLTDGSKQPKQLLQAWADEYADKLVELSLPLDTALQEIDYYRAAIGNVLKEEAKQQQLTIDEFYEMLNYFNVIVDEAGYIISRMYVAEHERTLKNAHYAVEELSVPLVRVTKETGVIPIIGDIDTKRAQTIMTNALHQSAEYELDTVIMDLQGVNVIDTMVADQLFKVINALEVSGVHAILSGLRPDIAQTMVQLGINMKKIETNSSLLQALEKSLGPPRTEPITD
ncbi:STAS domain-containing protein [Salimicrobium flavidum]|uniref:RsbT co-antagonist protein RsbR n=1 Tax=Salimicrobium flavidum TaxID=570947 RepID=A0A1N7JFM2_9BACI|nr:STAS domain-containing protein [Salimicrobium flavidum]SIS48044.1 rsbT co-antagonist protein RsbR [Salimicrobium flavidum]